MRGLLLVFFLSGCATQTPTEIVVVKKCYEGARPEKPVYRTPPDKAPIGLQVEVLAEYTVQLEIYVSKTEPILAACL